MIKPSTLSGFMELLPGEQIVFNRFVQSIASTFESFGAAPLDTPVMEREDIILANAGGETGKQIYTLTKGDTRLALRFDLTVPLAKYVALYANELKFPFKRYHIGKVYRGERAQKGRFREFYQCDIDVVGSETLNLNYDAEMIAVAARIFQSLGFTDFAVHFNNRKLVSGLMSTAGVNGGLQTEVMRVIDKLPKIGIESVKDWLAELKLNAEQIALLTGTMGLSGRPADVLAKLGGIAGPDDLFKEGAAELKAVWDVAQALGVEDRHMVLDLSIVRGLDYYTGTVYETFVGGRPEFGSVMSGGRYENLAENYTAQKLPGVGISLGLTRLFDLMRSTGMIGAGASAPTLLLVLPMDIGDPAQVKAAAELAANLRDADIPVDVLWDDKKSFKGKMSLAGKMKVPFAAIIGADEVKAGKIALKNMATG